MWDFRFVISLIHYPLQNACYTLDLHFGSVLINSISTMYTQKHVAFINRDHFLGWDTHVTMSIFLDYKLPSEVFNLGSLTQLPFFSFGSQENSSNNPNDEEPMERPGKAFPCHSGSIQG